MKIEDACGLGPDLELPPELTMVVIMVITIVTIIITITRHHHHHHHQHQHLSIIYCLDACHQQEGGGGESKWRRGLADFFFKNHVTLGKIHSKFMRFF